MYLYYIKHYCKKKVLVLHCGINKYTSTCENGNAYTCKGQ